MLQLYVLQTRVQHFHACLGRRCFAFEQTGAAVGKPRRVAVVDPVLDRCFQGCQLALLPLLRGLYSHTATGAQPLDKVANVSER